MPRRVRLLLWLAAALAATLATAGCGGARGSRASARRADGGGASAEQVANGPDGADAGAGATAGAAGAAVRLAPSRAPVPILMYHVIAPAPPGAKYGGLWVAPAAFREQVAALAAAGFHAVTLDAVLDGWAGKAPLPPHPIVLSFDDGYLSQGKAAGAILGARRWPGVLNLAWHNLGVPGGLTAGRIRDLVHAGWEIDAHSLTHPDLTTLDPTALRREVAGSRAAIRRAFGVPVDAFCYPAGRFDPAVEAAVRAAGYRAATTERPGDATPSEDHFALSRIRVNAGESAAAVVAMVRGAAG